MDTDLQRFRERLRGKQKQPRDFKFKDWLSIVLALAAFALSTFTAYWQYLRVVDDVRLAIGLDWPGLDVKDGEHATIYARQRLTFTNAGNRATAVTEAELILGVPVEHLEGQCASNLAAFPSALPLVMDGFVIRPGEILVKEISLKPKQPLARDDDGAVVVDLATKHDQGMVRFNACLQLNVLTPDNDQHLAEVPLVAFEYAADFRGITRGRPISTPRTPVPLWKQR